MLSPRFATGLNLAEASNRSTERAGSLTILLGVERSRNLSEQDGKLIAPGRHAELEV